MIQAHDYTSSVGLGLRLLHATYDPNPTYSYNSDFAGFVIGSLLRGDLIQFNPNGAMTFTRQGRAAQLVNGPMTGLDF
jgi:hypothetical protein